MSVCPFVRLSVRLSSATRAEEDDGSRRIECKYQWSISFVTLKVGFDGNVFDAPFLACEALFVGGRGGACDVAQVEVPLGSSKTSSCWSFRFFLNRWRVGFEFEFERRHQLGLLGGLFHRDALPFQGLPELLDGELLRGAEHGAEVVPGAM